MAKEKTSSTNAHYDDRTAKAPAPAATSSSAVEERVHRIDPPADAPRTLQTIKVRATKMGYYDDKRRRTGDVFLIRAPYAGEDDAGIPITINEFSKKWMERVAGDTPERITTGNEELRRQHDEILATKRQGGVSTTDDSGDVLGT